MTTPISRCRSWPAEAKPHFGEETVAAAYMTGWEMNDEIAGIDVNPDQLH